MGLCVWRLSGLARSMIYRCSSEIGIEFGEVVVSWWTVSQLLLGVGFVPESNRLFANGELRRRRARNSLGMFEGHGIPFVTFMSFPSLPSTDLIGLNSSARP